jgi:hypothetical protein
MDASNFLMGLGVAPQASLVVRVFSGADADRQRDVVTRSGVASNNSYGLQAAGSGYGARDRTYDMLVRDADQVGGGLQPLVIVFSAGNQGGSGPTKEAKNIIAVASTRNNRDGAGNPGVGNINTVSGFSSRGPAQDGRTYPHLAAPGENIISTRSSQAGIVSCTTLAVGAPAMDPTYTMCSGTSMAAPHVTGSAALVTQWWRGFNAGANPSPAMVKALLVNGATDMGTADIPNNNEGWGRVDLSNVINTGIPSFYLDQSQVLGTTGDTWSAEFIPDNVALPVKVSVAWSDAPGAANANPALVNDLDLTVVESATTYLGNDFAAGVSTTGGAADSLNNLENVFLATPTGASFVVTVTGSNIAGDGIPGNADTTDQDFAVVIQNVLEVATVNIVKEVDSDADGAFDDDPSGWVFDVNDDGNPTQTTDATGMLTFKVLPGTYAINETDGPAGFWLTSASCEDDDSGAAVGTGVTDVEYEPPQTTGVTGVTLAAQQSITCTFSNEIDEAFVNILKRVDSEPDGVFDDDPSGWTFDVFDDGQPTQTTDATGMLQFVVRAGTYEVRETAQPVGDTGLWLVTASCEDDDTLAPVGVPATDQVFGPTEPPVAVTGVGLVSGQSITCTFDNQRMAGFLTGGGHIRNGKGKAQEFISYAGNPSLALDGTLHGNYQAHFHNVSNPNLVGERFKSSALTWMSLMTVPGDPADPPFSVFNQAWFQFVGTTAGMTCQLFVHATDHGEPARNKKGGDSDSIRLGLNCPGTAFDYSSADDFAEQEAPMLHNVDAGNLQIHPPKE